MLKPKKSLGQNFLIDNNILKKISKLKEINENNIIEIGPGTGNLTNEILKLNPKKLILIEKDSKLYSQLSENFKFRIQFWFKYNHSRINARFRKKTVSRDMKIFENLKS